MQRRQLGRTDLYVPPLCLGTMTFGEQNSAEEAFAQLDLALHQGIDFWDTAELYPVPPNEESQGRTEQILGQWFQRTGRRHEVILASKMAGPHHMAAHIRHGNSRFNAQGIRQAIDDSLTRLNTHYIDLYQLHWPERAANYFGKLGFDAAMAAQDTRDLTDLVDTLTALERELRDGRIRAIGLSNDTPWGLMHCLSLAEHLGLPRVASIQNPYNLLNRSFEIGLAEIACREDTGLLAYSPLAFGRLTNKYLHGAQPPDARLTRYTRFTRYNNAHAISATDAYAAIAEQHGLSLAQMALAFTRQQCFVTSTIIGATTLEQLTENIDSLQVQLDATIMAQLEAVHHQHPNPCP